MKLYKTALSMLILFGIVLASHSCGSSSEGEQAEGEWIRGSQEEQIEKIEKHFRGFGVAMAEMGYRYNELYWAGRDANWEYAEHQAEEIEELIELALERRPARERSAAHFLQVALPEINEAIEKRDSELFLQKYEALNASCNACHQAEKHGFIHIAIPEQRTSVVRALR